ncbi:hypothetical protein MNBD_NITROSPINAE01-697 [hydrothermal vent metagenome]|uniref:Flagellar hook-length control protein-like C-terminal domain-containing protein n=1 Tax=hydrothermal vent metagenome TaxID=652676 RepID=A0A3B1CBJ2_9ZZZZ
MFINELPPKLLEAAIKILGGLGGSKSLFQTGDIVEGTVVKTISPKEALVRIGGVELFAITETKLQTGQVITGRVDKTSPNVTISLLKAGGADQKAVELLRLLLPSKAPIGDALARVAEVIDKTDLPPKTEKAIALLKQALSTSTVELDKATPEILKKTIKNSGLYMEASLKEATLGKSGAAKTAFLPEGDIKMALGKALKLLEGEIARMASDLDGLLKASTKKTTTGTGEAERLPINTKQAKKSFPTGTKVQSKALDIDSKMAEIAKTRQVAHEIKNAINNIELNQLINAPLKREPGGTNFSLFQIPFVQGAFIESARVYIQPRDEDAEGKGKKEQGKSSIVFMLNMSALGPVRVDVTVGRGKITGSVYVLNDTVAGFMKNNMEHLSKKLESAGYEVWVNVSVADRKKVTEELETRAPIAEQGLINIKA